MRKYFLHICLIFLALNSYGQLTDTTVFFNENGLADSTTNIERILSLTKVSKMSFVQKMAKKYSDNDDFYIDDYYLEIRETYNDSIYYFRTIYESCCGKKNYHSEGENKVIYRESDKVFQISIYDHDDKLVKKGLSLLIAPIIWDGEVDFFNDEGILTVKKYFQDGIEKSIKYFDRNDNIIENPTKTPEDLPKPINSEDTFGNFISKYIAQNFEYPETAKSNSQMPIIYIGFIVSTEGKIESLHFLRNKHELFYSQIEKLFYNMPKFKPAMTNGEAVNFLYYLPLRHYIR